MNRKKSGRELQKIVRGSPLNQRKVKIRSQIESLGGDVPKEPKSQRNIPLKRNDS